MTRHATRPTPIWLLAFCTWGMFSLTVARAERIDVAEELERLMGIHGFSVQNLEETRDYPGRADGDALVPRLRLLLEDFDHVIVQNPDGGVDRILILGEKVAYTPPQRADSDSGDEDATESGGADEIILKSQRRGTSHAITLTLEGENGKRVQRVLLLDTGADYVVLPSSLIGQLGILPGDLRRQSVQTANGTVAAQLGKIKAVWLGKSRIPDIETAFIEDSRLGGNALLGMSVLGRFLVTIDDENNQIVLTSKQQPTPDAAPGSDPESTPPPGSEPIPAPESVPAPDSKPESQSGQNPKRPDPAVGRP